MIYEIISSFKIGNFELRFYSICILLAFIAVYFIVKKEAKRFKISGDFIFNLAFWVFIAGVIGARLWYVVFNFKEYALDFTGVFKIWEGGLAIHGGIIFGLYAMHKFCKKYNFRLIRMTDFVAPALLVGQAIGRWGNFFNGEAHGGVIEAATLSKYLVPKFIVEGMTINGVTYVPTFLIESIACLGIFIVLLFVRRYKDLKVGSLTAFYLISYGLVRFFIELQRTDSLMIGDVKIAQIISIIFFIIGMTILIYNTKKQKNEDLYNDTSNVPDLKF